jgi:hypothetical protein
VAANSQPAAEVGGVKRSSSSKKTAPPTVRESVKYDDDDSDGSEYEDGDLFGNNNDDDHDDHDDHDDLDFGRGRGEQTKAAAKKGRKQAMVMLIDGTTGKKIGELSETEAEAMAEESGR